MTDQDSSRREEPAGAPSPEGMTGDPGAAGPVDVGRDPESGLAVGETGEAAGAYGGVLDGGELADSVDAGTLGGQRPRGAIPASPAPERPATTAREGRERGEL
ncbi:MAG: hypothetical protein NVSMB29_00240 [Candidatus Dormibacteria bacterium]